MTLTHKTASLLFAVATGGATGWQVFGGGGNNALDEIVQGKHPKVELLDDSKFEPFVSAKNTVSAVIFIAPWCFICPVILPMWAAAAGSMATASAPTPQFALIDVTKYPSIAEANHIHAFPTMKLFVDDEVFIYTHESLDVPVSAASVVNWVNRHTNRTNLAATETELTEFLKNNHLAAVGLFASDDGRDEFTHSCLHFEDVACIQIPSSLASVLAKITEKPAITSFPALAMIYDHDDKYSQYSGEWKRDPIDSFVRGRRLLTVNVFQPGTIEYILDAGLPMLYLTSPAGFDDSQQKQILSAVAKKFLGKVVAVTVGTSQPWEQKLAELLDVKEVQSPVIRILSQPPSQHHDHDPVGQSQTIIRHGLKYKPSQDGTITEASLTDFVSSFLSGVAKPYIRSEPEPEDPNDSFTPGSILVNAVATNFDKFVTDDIKRDILVVYHAPWCGFCRKLMPTLRDLGLKLGHTGATLKVVKIDATRNEIPNVSIAGYPTLVLYKAVSARVPIDQREAVMYSGDRSIEDVVKFLHEKATNPFPDVKPWGAPSGGANPYSAFEEL